MARVMTSEGSNSLTPFSGVQCSDERQYDICLSMPGVQETAEESFIDLRSSARCTRSIDAILRSTTSN
ncbi:hypothetical protein BgiBS90_030909, partial [Biomphalaria glabrata]